MSVLLCLRLGSSIVRLSKDASTPVVTMDWDRLRRSSMDDLELAAELIELFLDDTALQLASLSRCIAESDAAATRRLAHLLKGGCLTIGAARMADICEQLETACEIHSFNDAPRMGTLLTQEFTEVAKALRKGSWEEWTRADMAEGPESVASGQ